MQNKRAAADCSTMLHESKSEKMWVGQFSKKTEEKLHPRSQLIKCQKLKSLGYISDGDSVGLTSVCSM